MPVGFNKAKYTGLTVLSSPCEAIISGKTYTGVYQNAAGTSLRAVLFLDGAQHPSPPDPPGPLDPPSPPDPDIATKAFGFILVAPQWITSAKHIVGSGDVEDYSIAFAVVPLPPEFRNLHPMIWVLQFTPVTPLPLFPTAQTLLPEVPHTSLRSTDVPLFIATHREPL